MEVAEPWTEPHAWCSRHSSQCGAQAAALGRSQASLGQVRAIGFGPSLMLAHCNGMDCPVHLTRLPQTPDLMRLEIWWRGPNASPLFCALNYLSTEAILHPYRTRISPATTQLLHPRMPTLQRPSDLSLEDPGLRHGGANNGSERASCGSD